MNAIVVSGMIGIATNEDEVIVASAQLNDLSEFIYLNLAKWHTVIIPIEMVEN